MRERTESDFMSSSVEGSTEEDRNGASVESSHPPLSPANPAEMFFLQQPGTSDRISAFALAAEIQQNRRGSSSSQRSSNLSTATDDFASACENSTDANFFYDDYIGPSHSSNSLFGKDVLVLPQPSIPEDNSFTFEDSIMNSEPTTNNTSAGPSDIAQNVYKGAKGIWSWGKEKTPFSPFLGLAEGVASKVIGVAGSNLEEIDGTIQPQLAGLDSKFLNPTLYAIVELILGGVSKSENFIRPVVMTVLGPVGLGQVKGEKKEVEEKKKQEKMTKDLVAPEITTPGVAVN